MHRRWVAVGIMLLGLAWGLGGEWVSISRGVEENHLLDALTGLSYFLGGALALDRRPGNLIGPLMLALGFSWFSGNWANIPEAWSLPLLNLSQAAAAGLLAHLVISYPTGRMTTRFERLVVATTYLVPVLAVAGSLVTIDPATCPACPTPPTLYADAGLSDGLRTLYDDSAWVLVPLLAAALLLRWRRSSPAARHDLAPLWVVAWILVALFSLSPVTANTGSGFGYLLWEVDAVLQIAVPWTFVYGLLSTRLAQSAIGGLVVELDSRLGPGQLRPLLAQTLSDPGLEVAYPFTEGAWVDAEGRPVRLGGPDGPAGTTSVERDGRTLAALIHDPALDPDLVRATAAAAGMALDNERLHAELRAQLAEVRASRERIVRAGDAERRRVERDLHDGAQQRLLTLSLALHSARRQQAAGEQEQLAQTLERAGGELVSALQELRELARGIHPSVLTDGGLAPALEMLASRAPIPVEVDVDDRRYPPTTEVTAYYVVSEALANASKHAAASRGRVAARCQGAVLRVEVCDDGHGGAEPSRGTGLAGLADRVTAVGGRLVIESPPGRGTTVRAELPCQEAR